LIDQNQSEASLVQDIGKGINLAIKNAYALTNDMISDNIKAKTFPRMLQELAFRLHNYSKSNCELILNISHISPSDQYHAHHLYYIAREALHNALKHSKAQKIKIEWAIIDNHPSMMIIDNGCGIKKPFKGGLEIKIMKLHGRMMNADFNIKRTQEGGTIISCCS